MTQHGDDHTATDEQRYVPVPAGTTRVFEWEGPNRTGLSQPSRAFVGSVRRVKCDWGGDIEVRIEGIQLDSGFPERGIRCTFPGDDILDTTQARLLSNALAAAAAEVNQMNALDFEIASGRRDGGGLWSGLSARLSAAADELDGGK